MDTVVELFQIFLEACWDYQARVVVDCVYVISGLPGPSRGSSLSRSSEPMALANAKATFSAYSRRSASGKSFARAAVMVSQKKKGIPGERGPNRVVDSTQSEVAGWGRGLRSQPTFHMFHLLH